jgi:hypothetical protein
MSRRHRFEQLLKNPRIRQGKLDAHIDRQFLPTGFASLDNALNGGWPSGVLIEFLIDAYGVGEFSVLLPALIALADHRGKAQQAALTESDKWIMLVAPPYLPYAPALVQRGMNVSRLLVSQGRCEGDVLWATEQALRSGSCAAVLVWSKVSDTRRLRRLQLAAEASNSWAVLFRPARFRSQRSPAALRIHLQPGFSSSISMDIFKNRGGRPHTVVVSNHVDS